MTAMTATQIAAEMARLAALLLTAVESEDFDGDRAAVLGSLATVIARTSTTLDVLGEQASNDDGEGWETVADECLRAIHLLGAVAIGARVAAKAAKAEQAKTASLLALTTA
ncbi:hypothetical protein OG884_26650 [Streptosporangium sp. NBC_01755]|uniref:hypothetical protein n=1 Tax=Streptosporangium sp. NBC_01755 TaxID=2975949 RepID=UPI002DD8CB18|nr:hypothetical protein [Streptosporangium sp. NBC_01755]WSC98430.1 hypothetical protein OG884_26650 [Streptosporangium sp. NBC_01755]